MTSRDNTNTQDQNPESAPKKMLGSDIVIESLIRQGVTKVFAYPGGQAIPLHQSLTRYRDEIKVILPRHEQGGGFAAQGYARATGKVGVCMSTSGPGATNLVTALADAKMDSIPIIAITGQVPHAVIGTDAFQETPIVDVCRCITKHYYLVTSIEELTLVMREAFEVAQSGRPGPVLIDLPRNVQISEIVPEWEAERDPELVGYSNELVGGSNEQIDAIVEKIRLSHRPVVYAGGGIIASEASEKLVQFAEKTNIPVTTTLMALGAIPGDHPLSLRMPGMHGTVYANHALAEADLILAFGTRFDDRVTGNASKFAPKAQIVHVDIDPSEINKIKEAHIPIVADVRQALDLLCKMVEPPEDIAEWTAQCAEWKRTEPFHYDTQFDGILPQHAISELWRLTRQRETIVTVGVGQHQMWTAQYFKFQEPRTFHSSSGLGTMGFGLPAALGVQAAHPGALVVDIDGDGSTLMNVQELATAYCEELPVKVLLLNNQHLGMVVQWEDRFMGGNRAHTYLGPIHHPEASGQGNGLVGEERYPDFVTIAKGFGCGAASVRRKADLAPALEEMINHQGPYVLDVVVPYQEHVLPMIPAQGTVADLIKE